MTSIGFAIMDYFLQSMMAVNLSKDKKTIHRDMQILESLYRWEEPPDSIEELAAKRGLSTERVRQIYQRGLQKIARAAHRKNVPAYKIIDIIKHYGPTRKKDHAYETIINIWHHEMPELPALMIVRMLTWIFFNSMKDAISIREYYKYWNNEKKKEERRRQAEEIRKTRRQHLLNEQLLSRIIWFSKIRTWSFENFRTKTPKRTVQQKDRYESGKILSDKCQREVQYESGVEKAFINKLEENDRVSLYLEQPVAINYSKNQKDYQYTPDFAVLLDDGRCFIAEVKATFDDMLDARVHRRLEALMNFCEEHGMGILLTNGIRSLDYLLDYPFNPAFKNAILQKLKERGGRTIFLYEFKKLMSDFNATKTEFLAIVLKFKLGYYPYPFKLTPYNSHPAFINKLLIHLQTIKK